MFLVGQVFLGNVLTICFVWGMMQFKKHDYKAPWLAYAGVVFPVFYFLTSWLPTVPIEHLPPQFDALVTR